MANETNLPNRVIFSPVAANRLEVLIGGGIKFILFGAIFFVPGLLIMLIGAMGTAMFAPCAAAEIATSLIPFC